MGKTPITDNANKVNPAFRQLAPEDIPATFLASFHRYQHTDKVWADVDDVLILKEEQFIDDWDQARLKEVSMELHDCAKRGGIVLGAFDGDICIGFTAVLPDRFGSRHQYAEMTLCHVDQHYRGFGIGRALFQRTCRIAKARGIEKLYLSTHPSVETQGFYRSVGCVQAREINPEILAREPLDIQLEKHL